MLRLEVVVECKEQKPGHELGGMVLIHVRDDSVGLVPGEGSSVWMY